MKARYFLPLLLIGIAIRVYYLAGVSHAPEFRVPVLDSRWYHDRAVAWSEGEAGGGEDAFRAPLYPFALGQLYKLFGTGPYVARLFQLLLGIGSLLLVRAIGDRAFGRPAGLVAFGMMIFYYPFAYFENEILVTTFFLFFLLLGAYLLLRAEGNGPALRLAGGLALGLATAARPTSLALYPFLLLWEVRRLRGVRRRAAWPLALLLAGLLLPPGIVAAWNLHDHGDFDIASQGGVNLYIGNGPAADGKTASVPGWYHVSYETKEYEDDVSQAARRIAEEEAGRPLSPSEVSRHWFAKTWRWMRAHPGGALVLFLKKAYFLVNRAEIPNNRLIASYVKEYAPLAYYLTPGAGILIALGMAGLFVPGGARAAKELLALFLAVLAAGVVLFFVCSRFRLPLMPFWILFGAHGLTRLFSERKRFPFARAIPLFFVFLVLSHTAWFGVDQARDEHVFHFNRAYAFAATRDLARAEEEYRESLRIFPGSPRVRINLGSLLAERGKPAEAEAMLRSAIAADSSYAPLVWNNLGLTLMLEGEWEGARLYLEKAAARDPSDGDVLANLGNVLLALGHPAEALERYEGAARAGTERIVLVRLGRAMALADLGRQDEALAVASRAAGAIPDSRGGWVIVAAIARLAGKEEVARGARARFLAVAGRPPAAADLPSWWRGGRSP